MTIVYNTYIIIYKLHVILSVFETEDLPIF